MTRFFVPGVFDVGDTVELAEPDAHRVRRVLRLREGAAFAVCDEARVYTARLEEIEPACRVRLLARVPTEPEAAITLAQCLPKAGKMDFVVEKAIEAGAARIVPVRSARVVRERGGHAGKLDRWRRLARSASEQSAAPHLVEVTEETGWESLLASFASYDLVLVAWERAPKRTRRLDDLPARPDARILLVIGPEGGLTEEEATGARAAGARVFSLGSRILRTETAGAVAIGILRYALDIQASPPAE